MEFKFKFLTIYRDDNASVYSRKEKVRTEEVSASSALEAWADLGDKYAFGHIGGMVSSLGAWQKVNNKWEPIPIPMGAAAAQELQLGQVLHEYDQGDRVLQMMNKGRIQK